MVHAVPCVLRRLLLLLCLAALLVPAGAGRTLAAAGGRQMTLLVPSRVTVDAPVDKVAAGGQPAAGHVKDGKAEKGDARKAAKAPAQAAKTAKTAAPRAEQGQPPAGGAVPAPAPAGATPAAEPLPQTPPMEEIVAQVNASVMASASPAAIDEEVLLLACGMELAEHRGIPMDMPRIFTVYRFDREAEKPDQPVWREDLLGDIEEIRYLDQKAWGANVGLERPGLHQFSIETRPWWNAEARGYEQQLVKTMLPVYGEDWGWHLPVGMSFEIVPGVRPFGLRAPALFSGRVLVDGRPAAGLEVELERVNTDDVAFPSPWHRVIATRTGEDGGFAAVLGAPGWWCCRAAREGEPLKGPDGEPSPLRLATLFWFYVDSAPAAR